MKLVTVFIRLFKLEEVREALSNIGVNGLTVSEVKEFGNQKGPLNFIVVQNVPLTLFLKPK